MTKSVWIYLIIFVLVTPLFILDMYERGSVNITFIVAIVLLITFLSKAFKNRNTNKGDMKEESKK